MGEQVQPLLTIMTDGTIRLACSATIGELLGAVEAARKNILNMRLDIQPPEGAPSTVPAEAQP